MIRWFQKHTPARLWNFLVDVTCFFIGHDEEIVDWRNVPWKSPASAFDDKKETQAPEWVMVECKRCGRARIIR